MDVDKDDTKNEETGKFTETDSHYIQYHPQRLILYISPLHSALICQQNQSSLSGFKSPRSLNQSVNLTLCR